MEDMKNGDKQSRILQGMYVNLTAKMEEIRQAVSKELQFGSAQQTYVYDTLTSEVKTGMEKILSELQYLAQQNSAINDFASEERQDIKSAVADTRAALADLHEAFQNEQAQAREALKELEERLISSIDSRIHDSLQALMPPPVEIDYDLLAQKVAACIAPVSAAAEEVPETPAASEEAEPAETVAGEETAEEVVAEGAEESAEPAEPVETEETEETAGEIALPAEENFAYDILAEKIAGMLPETDYDAIVDKVIAALPTPDAEGIAEKIVAILQQDDMIASHIAEAIPLADYTPIAERLSVFLDDKTFRLTDEAVEAIAVRVAELLRGDAVDLERLMSDAEPEEPAAEPEEVAEEIAPEAVKPEPKPVAPKPAPVVVPVVEDESKMVRYKRSFVAKIIGSEEEVKEYYSDLKNAILCYGKVRSQINWTNDRFFIGNDSIIKIAMRGRTLCVYLALNPDEFPETVYHQKFAGDTKMYELTPMMVKVKSAAAVKKVIRLIDLLMERNGAVKEDRERVDYAAQYFFRTDEELLAEGLIKTAIVDKSDMDF